MDDAEERFTLLYDRYYRNVLGYVLLRAEQAVAEDVCSETFLVAWRRLDELPEQVLPWLLGVARNKLAKHREVRARRQSLAERISALTGEREHVAWDVAEHVVDREQAISALLDDSSSRLSGAELDRLARLIEDARRTGGR